MEVRATWKWNNFTFRSTCDQFYFSKRNHCGIKKWSNLYLHSTENRSKYKPTETSTMSIHIELGGHEINARWNIDQNGIDKKQKASTILGQFEIWVILKGRRSEISSQFNCCRNQVQMRSVLNLFEIEVRREQQSYDVEVIWLRNRQDDEVGS